MDGGEGSRKRFVQSNEVCELSETNQPPVEPQEVNPRRYKTSDNWFSNRPFRRDQGNPFQPFFLFLFNVERVVAFFPPPQ